jgi:hypothetical protein
MKKNLKKETFEGEAFLKNLKKQTSGEENFFDSDSVLKHVLDRVIEELTKIRKELDGPDPKKLGKVWNTSAFSPKETAKALEKLDQKMIKSGKNKKYSLKNTVPNKNSNQSVLELDNLWPHPSEEDMLKLDAKYPKATLIKSFPKKKLNIIKGD